MSLDEVCRDHRGFERAKFFHLLAGGNPKGTEVPRVPRKARTDEIEGLPELRRLRNGRQIFRARNSGLEIRGPTSASRSASEQMACQMPRYRQSAEKRGHPAFAVLRSRAIVAEEGGQPVPESAA